MMRQVILMAHISMVGMGMGYHGIIHRLPGVDVKFPLGAVNAHICKLQQWFGHSVVITDGRGIGFNMGI
jgi:hypothetical protein